MNADRKAQLIRNARRCMTRAQFLDYMNYLNNYEYQSARNDERINAEDGKRITTL